MTLAPSFDIAEWAQQVVGAMRDALSEEDLALLNSQVRALASTAPATATLPPDLSAVCVVRDRKRLKEVGKLLVDGAEVAIDLETSSLDPKSGDIVGVGVAIDAGNFYVPINHRIKETGLLQPDQLPLDVVATELKLASLSLVAHNAKFEFQWLRRHAGIACRFVWDTMLAARLLASHLPADLKDLAARELDVPDWSLSKDEIKSVQFLSPDHVGRYCGKDCYYTLELMRRQQACKSLSRFLMDEVEMPLVPVVASMEENGYQVRPNHFEGLRDRLEPEQENVLEQIRKVAGEDFNPGSSKQVGKLLYGRLKLKVTRRTEAGEPATDKIALESAAKDHPVASAVQRYRGLNKIIGTYCTIPDKVGGDGRLRVSFNQLAARTGRFSSSGIIQTLPKNDEFQIRHGFVAKEGYRIVGVDFDQQELRVLAQCSGDKYMRSAIEAGVDLHGLAAVKVFKLSCEPNEVKGEHPEQRNQVKAIQFGLLYGRSAFSLAGILGLSVEEAEQLIDSYFQQFPGVKQFIEGVHTRLMRDGFVDDLFGRRRHFPVVKKKMPRAKEWSSQTEAQRELAREIRGAKREAQNFMIQGVAATITKLAMLRCHDHITAEHPDVKMIVQLHDELQFEVPCDLVEHFAQELPSLMCELGLERFGFKVPMKVEVKAGPSWGELKKWEGQTHA